MPFVLVAHQSEPPKRSDGKKNLTAFNFHFKFATCPDIRCHRMTVFCQCSNRGAGKLPCDHERCLVTMAHPVGAFIMQTKTSSSAFRKMAMSPPVVGFDARTKLRDIFPACRLVSSCSFLSSVFLENQATTVIGMNCLIASGSREFPHGSLASFRESSSRA